MAEPPRNNPPDNAPAPARAEQPETAPEPEPNPVDALPSRHRDTLERALALTDAWQPAPGVLGDLPQVTVPAAHIVDVCRACRDDAALDCQLLLCLACVDYEERFDLVYFLQSLKQERTLVVKAGVPYDAPSLPSVAGVWPAADWYEREAHDLFGIVFQGHPDLSPLLLYPEFEGFPGRKSYSFFEYREF